MVVITGNDNDDFVYYNHPNSPDRTVTITTKLYELPYWHGLMKTVEELTITNNDLTEIPIWIFNLSTLKKLNLSHNKITKIAIELKKLKLEELNLSFNDINEIPDWVDHFKNLKILRINNNKIEKLPKSLYNLVNITELNISYNSISVLSDSIRKLINLNNLYANNNKLKKIPDSFCDLTKIRCIKMSYNELETLPENIYKLNINVNYGCQLNEVDFSHNKITNVPDSLCYTYNKSINLSYNLLTKVPKEYRLGGNYSINLSGNPIRIVEKDIKNNNDQNYIYHNFEINIPPEMIPKKIEKKLLSLNDFISDSTINEKVYERNNEEEFENILKDKIFSKYIFLIKILDMAYKDKNKNAVDIICKYLSPVYKIYSLVLHESLNDLKYFITDNFKDEFVGYFLQNNILPDIIYYSMLNYSNVDDYNDILEESLYDFILKISIKTKNNNLLIKCIKHELFKTDNDYLSILLEKIHNDAYFGFIFNYIDDPLYESSYEINGTIYTGYDILNFYLTNSIILPLHHYNFDDISEFVSNKNFGIILELLIQQDKLTDKIIDQVLESDNWILIAKNVNITHPSAIKFLSKPENKKYEDFFRKEEIIELKDHNEDELIKLVKENDTDWLNEHKSELIEIAKLKSYKNLLFEMV